MKKTILATFSALTLVIALGFGFTPTASCAGDARCEYAEPNITKEVFTKFAETCGEQVEGGQKKPKLCFVSSIYQKVVPILTALNKDGRFTLGGRVLLFNEPQNGALRLGTGRNFVSQAPVSTENNSARVTVTKKGGKGGAFVRICGVDSSDNVTHLGTLRFADNGKPETQSTTVTGVGGKVIALRVESFNGAFDYSITTSL
jgi:hypothetical protein